MSDGALPENVKKLLHDAAAKLKAAPASNDPKQTYEEAIELTKRATEKSPDTSEVWSEYAMALLCLNRREKAWEAYRKSLALSKGRPKSMKFCSRAQAVQFARMHEEHGKLDDAEEQLNLLTDHSPKYPGGWLELARFYLRTDRIEDAEFTLTHGLHEVEHETLYLALAQVQALHGRMDQALYRAKEALSAKPEFFEALMYVALFAHRLQRDKEETEALTKAAEIVEKHPEMKSSYENMLDLIINSEVVVFWQKDAPMAKTEPDIEEPEPLEKPKPTAKFKPEPAVSVKKPRVETPIEAKPKDAEAKPDMKSGEPEDTLRQKTEESPGDPGAWYNFGEYLRTVEKYIESENALKESIRLNPNHSDAYRSLGMLYLATNRVDEGDRAFRRAVSLNPASSDSWLGLARHQFKSGDFSAALNSINRCLQSEESNYEGWHILAQIYLKLNKVKDAEKAAKRSVDLKISFAEGWKTLGEILDRRGKRNDALEAFRNVIEINPDDSMGWSNLGVAFIKAKRTREALSSIQKAVELDPENITAWKNLVTLHRQEGRIREADAANEKFLELQKKKAHT